MGGKEVLEVSSAGIGCRVWGELVYMLLCESDGTVRGGRADR